VLLIFDHDLDSVKMNRLVKYTGHWSFALKFIVCTEIDTKTEPTDLCRGETTGFIMGVLGMGSGRDAYGYGSGSFASRNFRKLKTCRFWCILTGCAELGAIVIVSD